MKYKNGDKVIYSVYNENAEEWGFKLGEIYKVYINNRDYAFIHKNNLKFNLQEHPNTWPWKCFTLYKPGAIAFNKEEDYYKWLSDRLKNQN